MNFLLDTDTCVYFLRGNPNVHARINQVGRDEVALSIVSLVELRYGAEYSADSLKNHGIVDAFVEGIVVLGIDDWIARRFGQIKSRLRRDGQLIADFDLLIAATALSRNLTLVTNNTVHFERVPDLALQNWLDS